MASKAVNAVLEAENLAKKQVESVKLEAEEIIRNAKEKSAIEYDRIVAEAKEKKHTAVSAASENADKLIEKAHIKAQNEAQTIISDYEKMTDQAISTVLNIIG